MASLTTFLCLVGVALTYGQVSINLGTGAVTGSVSPANGLQWVVQPPSFPFNPVCNLKGVLKLTFNLNTRKRARIDMVFSGIPSGWTFNIGDSKSNDGYAGDAGDQSNDAEVHSIGRTIYFYGKDNPAGGSFGLLYSQDNFISNTVTVDIKDELATAYSAGNFIYINSPKMFALRGQPDSTGPVNYDVYLAMNRVVTGRADRVGTGLCQVTITWFNN